jgi:hypothetical protein
MNAYILENAHILVKYVTDHSVSRALSRNTIVYIEGSVHIPVMCEMNCWRFEHTEQMSHNSQSVECTWCDCAVPRLNLILWNNSSYLVISVAPFKVIFWGLYTVSAAISPPVKAFHEVY